MTFRKRDQTQINLPKRILDINKPIRKNNKPLNRILDINRSTKKNTRYKPIYQKEQQPIGKNNNILKRQ